MRAIPRVFVRTCWAVRGTPESHCVGYSGPSGTVRACAPQSSARTPAGMAAPAPHPHPPGRPYKYPEPTHAVPCTPHRPDTASGAATEPNSARAQATGLSPRTQQVQPRLRPPKTAADTSAQTWPTTRATAATGAAAPAGSSGPTERSPRRPGPTRKHWAPGSAMRTCRAIHKPSRRHAPLSPPGSAHPAEPMPSHHHIRENRPRRPVFAPCSQRVRGTRFPHGCWKLAVAHQQDQGPLPPPGDLCNLSRIPCTEKQRRRTPRRSDRAAVPAGLDRAGRYVVDSCLHADQPPSRPCSPRRSPHRGTGE